LLSSLIDSYFRCHNVYFPLLHRPTFDRAVASRLHHADASFGAVLLLVCAHGAWHIDNPRVQHISGCYESTGWGFFSQIRLDEISLMGAPRLHAVQICIVSTYICDQQNLANCPSACNLVHVFFVKASSGVATCRIRNATGTGCRRTSAESI
jgi:hypothetical protein